MILALLCGLSSAWGPAVNAYICEKAAMGVWGAEVVRQCIPNRDSGFLESFCENNAVTMGKDNYEKCVRVFSVNYNVHPADIPVKVFEDEELHQDYFHCPIIKGSERWWICGDKSERPAIDLSERWFSAAGNATDVCTRVYDFCVAASYYSDSESELHQVRGFYNDCKAIIESAAESLIRGNLSSWSAGYTCRFQEGRGSSLKDYRQRLGVGASDVARAVEYLKVRGATIRDLPLRPTNGIILFSNSLDMEAAQDIRNYLANRSVTAQIVDSEGFKQARYSGKVIILGGHNAPEGVGEAVSTILSQAEKESLMARGAREVFTREDVWSQGQKVIVIAGNEMRDTADAVSENKAVIMSELG